STLDVVQLTKCLPTLVNLVLIKLTDKNYLLWQHQSTPLLNRKQIDQLIMSWIFSTIIETVLADVISLLTSKGVWNTLKDSFIQHSKMQEIELRQKIQACRKGTQSMSTYIKEFKRTCEELDCIQKPLLDEDKISWLLIGLDRTYNVIQTPVQTRERHPTFKEVQAMLLAEEALQNSYDVSPAVITAFAAEQSRSFGRFRGWRDQFFGRSYHRGHGRGFPNSGYTHNNSQSNFLGRNSLSKPTCQICGIRGHTTLEC
ncbi:hypothetical protein GIB67_029484, partial [Kingdonia uniflora]